MNATYRLQLTPDFGFADARAILPYLQGLGISHVYLSPVTEARRGSTHGYDVTDHNALRAELGGAAQFLALLQEAQRLGLRLVLDFVPNH
ncbi:MAG TPA: alpha-amylase family glycosyl hydrolase, partial [Myxococcota bacterium]|nr:alpha-amylase family glycosyl hydrolase [Myxococcota bacterium]